MFSASGRSEVDADQIGKKRLIFGPLMSNIRHYPILL